VKLILFLALFVAGPAVIFGFIRRGWRLLWPAVICFIGGFFGIGLFVWGMGATSAAAHHNGDIATLGIIGIFLALCAAFGAVLLGIVLIARWLSGDYKASKQEMLHD
jgi:hypothetical protein